MRIPDGLHTEVGLFCVLLRTVFPKLPPEQGLSTVRRVRRCLRALLDGAESPTEALASQCIASCELSAAFILRRLHTGHQSETLLMVLATLARIRALLLQSVSVPAAMSDQILASQSQDPALLSPRSEQTVVLQKTKSDQTRILQKTTSGKVAVFQKTKSGQTATLQKTKSGQTLALQTARSGRNPVPVPSDPGTSGLGQDLGQPVARHETAVAKLKRLYRRLKTDAKDPSLLKKTCLRGLRDIRAGHSSLLAEAKKMRAAARKWR